ncbi:hypothetical protein CALVIDRAFT_368721 [Calocera viscosa TUFC12733]|uniref:Uncharacterized protein n=1 Tax=Calocera viscosa (strain TUFC12733) TaxID=1330018 RepID=A0A167GZQ4_CALVF|nr:hypothetical protein CALVIDRAFT_368721 [Calocera viscosa TUFC12733]
MSAFVDDIFQRRASRDLPFLSAPGSPHDADTSPSSPISNGSLWGWRSQRPLCISRDTSPQSGGHIIAMQLLSLDHLLSTPGGMVLSTPLILQCTYGSVDGKYTKIKDCGKVTCSNSENWDPEAKAPQSPPKK